MVEQWLTMAFRLGFDVVLPVADLITDVIFTISIYKERGYHHSFFIYSGNCFIPHFLKITLKYIMNYTSIELGSYYFTILALLQLQKELDSY